MKKLILKKEFDIKKAAERRVEKVKVKNINNKFFSELDLIEESEEDLRLFLEEKDNFALKALYVVADKLSYIKKDEINEQYKTFFYDRLFLNLRENVVMKEVDRLYNLHKSNNLKITMRDIEHILQNKEIILYLKEKNVYNKSFFQEINKKLESNNLPDVRDYGNGRIKKIKREFKEVL